MKIFITLLVLVVALSSPAHTTEIPGFHDIGIGVGVELAYGVRELESVPPADLRDAKSIVTTASIKLTLDEVIEGLNLFLALGMAEVNVEYIESTEKIEVIGEDGKLVELGFRWCAPITGDPDESMRVGISYKYQIIMSGIEKVIKGGTVEVPHIDSEIEIKYHEFSLFISERLDFLTLYVGVRYSDILDMEIERPGESIIDFVAKERAGIVIGAEIPLGDLNLNFEVEALHEASLRFGGSITF